MYKIYPLLAFFALAFSLQLSAQDITQGLVVHYQFEDNLVEEKSGATAESVGTFVYAPGAVGKAIVYNFDDNYFLTPAEALVPGNSSTSYSLMVWHDPTVINTRRQNYLQQLNGNGETGRATLYLQSPTSGTNPDTIISFVGNGTSSSNYKMTLGGQWVHLGLVINPAATETYTEFYVNGTLVAYDTLGKAVEPSTGSYIVGHHKGLTTNTITLKGMMDELRFYDRALTAEEMRILAGDAASGTRETAVEASMAIVPNPAKSGQSVNIEIDNTVFTPNKPITLNVIDASGRVVLTETVQVNGQAYTLNHNLTPGMYTATLSDGLHIASAKLSIRQ